MAKVEPALPFDHFSGKLSSKERIVMRTRNGRTHAYAITNPYTGPLAESRKRARMLALNRDAARFFYEQLSSPGGQAARDYMAKRRIGPVTAKNFGLGFAPDSWDSLRKAMRAKGYTDFEMADAGLLRKRENTGFYDTFRNRLMFPVIDVRGNVIGFSGRILGDGEPIKMRIYYPL